MFEWYVWIGIGIGIGLGKGIGLGIGPPSPPGYSGTFGGILEPLLQKLPVTGKAPVTGKVRLWPVTARPGKR